MPIWTSENLRDLSCFRQEGLSFSTPSNETVKMFDALLRQLVAWTDDPQLGGMEGTLEKMLSVDPTAVLPRAFKCGLDVMSTGTSFRIDKDLEKEILDIEVNNKIEDDKAFRRMLH